MFRFPSRPATTNPDRVHHIHTLRTLAALDDALLRDIGVARPHSRHQVISRHMLG